MQEDAKTEEEPKAKRVRVNENKEGGSSSNNNNNNNNRSVLKRIETGLFSKIPPELFPHILKFLSSEVFCHLCVCVCVYSVLEFFDKLVQLPYWMLRCNGCPAGSYSVLVGLQIPK